MAQQLVRPKQVPEHRPWATERYVRRLIAENRIRHYKLGSGRSAPVLIDLADLDALAQAGRVEAS